jgi:hypothetical protein
VGDHYIGQLVLYEKEFCLIDFWELDPEVLGSLWLMAFAILGGGGGTLWRKDTIIRKVYAAAF